MLAKNFERNQFLYKELSRMAKPIFKLKKWQTYVAHQCNIICMQTIFKCHNLSEFVGNSDSLNIHNIPGINRNCLYPLYMVQRKYVVDFYW